MLAVITDDFTGASELAGIALAKGCRTVIETKTIENHDADVLVIATGMRSLSPEQAAKKSAAVTGELLAIEPELIFKKVDSVLRGNIGSELEAQMGVENKSSALLVPANPSRKRTIADGVYFVDGVPVVESGFSLNHDFASPTSAVVDILKHQGTDDAVCLSPGDPFPGPGLYIGNTRDANDLKAWAGRLTDEFVPAGAADFFSAILDTRRETLHNGVEYALNGGGRSLYICGSNFPSSRVAVAEAKRHGVSVLAMPDEIYYRNGVDSEAVDRWAHDVIEALLNSETVVVSAPQSPGDRPVCGRRLTEAMAALAHRVVKHDAIDDLMIEGGATSQAVMAALDIDCLYPSQSLAPGVTRMRVDGYPGLHITMKPGSYRWPEAIWDFTI